MVNVSLYPHQLHSQLSSPKRKIGTVFEVAVVPGTETRLGAPNREHMPP